MLHIFVSICGDFGKGKVHELSQVNCSCPAGNLAGLQALALCSDWVDLVIQERLPMAYSWRMYHLVQLIGWFLSGYMCKECTDTSLRVCSCSLLSFIGASGAQYPRM